MEESIADGFKYFGRVNEFWDSIKAVYAHKRNNAWTLESKKEITEFKQGALSSGNYSAKFRALWHTES